eukprot:CAMPEP_0172092364 /NCGR_PEP_ID=MMETSP1043-20130122/25400_1 /TAXON_ID=464988 /ORGANISM="Hemiselmis andersenii, Strain CCMP441" /LENGTH=214 /DNA_ID=CAMNT_0012755075 /DNA_START=1 /DNA_END=641 /DNA_ORIENTATION=+
MLAVWAFELWLDVRQRKKLLDKDMPDALKKVMSGDEFEQARLYSLDKNSYKMLEDAAITFKSALFYVMGGLPWMWGISSLLLSLIGRDPKEKDNEIVLSMVFCTVYYTKETLESLPWEMYREFVLEERHGFNKQSLSLFLMDQIKTYLLMVILGMPALGGVIMVIQMGGPYFYLYAWTKLHRPPLQQVHPPPRQPPQNSNRGSCQAEQVSAHAP